MCSVLTVHCAVDNVQYTVHITQCAVQCLECRARPRDPPRAPPDPADLRPWRGRLLTATSPLHLCLYCHLSLNSTLHCNLPFSLHCITSHNTLYYTPPTALHCTIHCTAPLPLHYSDLNALQCTSVLMYGILLRSL